MNSQIDSLICSNFEFKAVQSLTWPSFAGLHGEQGEHGSPHVIVVEIPNLPQTFVDGGGYVFATEYEELSLTLYLGHLRFVGTEPEFAIEQLHGNYCETEKAKRFRN